MAYGVVVNRSEICDYPVGLASYKKLDDIIDHQILHAYNDTTVGPGETLEFAVPLPKCAVQVDLYYGTHLPSLDGSATVYACWMPSTSVGTTTARRTMHRNVNAASVTWQSTPARSTVRPT